MNVQENLILMADAYKYSHHKLYYPGTNYVYSYLESRGGKFGETVFFGLQYYLKNYLEGAVITADKIEQAEALMHDVFGRKDVFDRARFDYILKEHGGHLPVRISAVPEGQVVPVSNVMMTIENTDPNCYWLTNFLETLLMQMWYPCTVATISWQVKQKVREFLEKTASPTGMTGIEFVLNDFGFRGVSSVESAGLGGMAHLLNFRGSDTIQGSVYAKRYYGAEQMFGLSIPATEHSICTLLGQEGELEVFRHILKTFPTGLVACVSDSFDIFKACAEYWGEELKEEILNRDGVLVIRPDSGDPVTTLKAIFELLFEKFGFTVNEKGYKVLPPQVRVIQGDGVNYDSIVEILEEMEKEKISTENLVFGMGGALLQKLDRDTQKFAIKCSYAEINGEGREVVKSPMEMDKDGNIHSSFKKSKGGKLALVNEAGKLVTKKKQDTTSGDLLRPVFENGKLVLEDQFEAIRERLLQPAHC